jgi:hypothetical protein
MYTFLRVLWWTAVTHAQYQRSHLTITIGYYTTTFLFLRTQPLVAMLPQIRVFWDVTPCHWASGSWRFETSYCLRLQGQTTQRVRNLGRLTLKVKALRPFKTLRKILPKPRTHAHTHNTWILNPPDIPTPNGVVLSWTHFDLSVPDQRKNALWPVQRKNVSWPVQRKNALWPVSVRMFRDLFSGRMFRDLFSVRIFRDPFS